MKLRRSSLNRFRLYEAVLILILFSIMAAETASSGTYKYVRPFRPDDTSKTDDRGAAEDAPTTGRTYTWTDKQGIFHMTDDLSKVPPEYRTVPAETNPAPMPPRRTSPYPTAAPGSERAVQSPAMQRPSSVFAGSWISRNLGYYGSLWAMQIDENGRGFAIGSDEKAIAKLTWRETDKYLAEIEVAFAAREKSRVQLIYDRPTGGLRMEPGSALFRKMSTPLPPLASARTLGRGLIAGLWARKLEVGLGGGSNGFLALEADGTGMFFDRLPGGHAFTSVMTSPNNFHLTIIPGGRQYAELSPEQIKGLNRSIYVTYDPEIDTLWMTESTGGNGAALFRIGGPLVRASAGAELDTLTGLRRLAEAGNASAALVLGWAHFEGQGTKRDANAGAKWIQRSAELGNAAAQCILGAMLYQGSYVPVNKPEGLKWLKLSAGQGYFYASVMLDNIDQQERMKK